MPGVNISPPTWSSAEILSLAEGMISQAGTYSTALNTAAAGLAPPSINPSFPAISSPPVPLTASFPPLINVNWNQPSAPTAFNGTLNVAPFLPGQFTGVAPTLNFGTAPAPFSGTLGPAPAVDLNFTYPTVALTLPDKPTLMSLDTVAFNPLAIPTFNVAVPQLTISPPGVVQYTEGALYTSALLSNVEASLSNALTNGTDTGLDATTQQAMWDAAREREYRQQADALAALDRDIEVLGYAFPPGAYLAGRVQIQTETNYTIAGLSRDIMVKQAELHLENVVKARENAVSLEGTLINYANQVAQRAFETAKYLTDAGVQIYNAQVQAYAATLEGFKAQVMAYDATIRGITAYVEELKAQIDFERTKAEINTALVSQYKTEVEAAEATLEIYKTQVEIIQIQANVEKIKVDVFNAQTQAFVGEVNAYTAQVEGYKAGIEAQGAIEQAYKTSVDAYSAQVQAGVAASQALIAQYRGQIEAYSAQIEAYKAALQAQVSQAQAGSLYNTAQSEVYKATVSGVSAYNQDLTAQWEAIINEQEKIAEVAVKAAEANGQLYISARGLALHAAEVSAQVAAQLGAAALGSIHYSNNSSWSLAGNVNASDSVSNNTSTNYNFDESV